MRAYFQLFFGLLLPLSALFIVTSFLYFNLDYDVTKSIRLSVLFGSILGVTSSFIMALFLLILRASRKSHSTTPRKKKKQAIKASNPTQKIKEIKKPVLKTQTNKVVTTHIEKVKDEGSIQQKIMLLMDRELAAEVMFHAIHEQNIGTLTGNNSHDGSLSIKTNAEVLHVMINALTRHTSQLIVTSPANSSATQKILSYMKEKEYSFLQY